jgi:hypothetical protein
MARTRPDGGTGHEDDSARGVLGLLEERFDGLEFGVDLLGLARSIDGHGRLRSRSFERRQLGLHLRVRPVQLFRAGGGTHTTCT